MKWSRSTIGLFILSMTFMVVSGFMLLMMLGSPLESPERRFAEYGLPLCVVGFVASGAWAWLNHRRQRSGSS